MVHGHLSHRELKNIFAEFLVPLALRFTTSISALFSFLGFDPTVHSDLQDSE